VNILLPQASAPKSSPQSPIVRTFEALFVPARALAAIVVICFCAAGCSSKKSPEASAPESVKVRFFTEDEGIIWSEESKRLFGVELVEVKQRPATRQVQKPAQVYGAAAESAPAKAMLHVTAVEAHGLHPGLSVALRQADGSVCNGTLVKLDSQTLPVLGQIEVLIEFPDPLHRCPAGTFVTGTFTGPTEQPIFVVPESALLATADGTFLYKLNGTHLRRTRVKVGTRCDGVVEIADGLLTGDSVAAKGIENMWLVELNAFKAGDACCPVARNSP